MATQRFLKATIAGYEVGLPVDAVGELVRCENVQYSPIAKGPLGWLLAPKEIELWQLYRAFGSEPPIHRGLPAIELVHDDARALVVDALGAVAELDSSQIFPASAVLEGGEQPLLSGIGILDGRPLPLIDPLAIASHSAPLGEQRWQPSQPAVPISLPVSPSDNSGQARPTKALQLDLLPPGSEGERSLGAIISLSQVRTVGSRPSRFQVPGVPPYVAGLSVWNGRPVSWIDLLQLLGLEASEHGLDRGRYVILETAKGGLLALGGIFGIETLESDTPIGALEAPSDFPQGLLLLEGIRNKTVVVVPDFDAIASMRQV